MKHVVLVRSMVAIGLVSALSAHPANSGNSGLPPLSQVRESVDYLASAYHITTSEALRRIRLDADSAAIGRRLAAALPAEYTGMWLDQRAGVLNVATTRPDRARHLVAGLPDRSRIRLRAATYSLRDLAAIRDRVAARLAGDGYAQLDPVRDQVAVWTEHPAQVSRRLFAAARVPAPVTVHLPPKSVATACVPLSCDPPMRAGVSVQLAKKRKNGGVRRFQDYCTSAFNIVDSKGALYASTAGHCFTEKPKAVYLARTDGDEIIADTTMEGSAIKYSAVPRLDYAIVRIKDPGTWLPADEPRNIDFFRCGTPSPHHCDERLNDEKYRITGIKNYGAMMVGDVVCMSGASPMVNLVEPGTRCGQITDLADGAIRTDICAKKGDSGSPLFDQATRTAFGIESSSTDVHAFCTKDLSKQLTYYTPLSTALADADANAKDGRTYTLITN